MGAKGDHLGVGFESPREVGNTAVLNPMDHDLNAKS